MQLFLRAVIYRARRGYSRSSLENCSFITNSVDAGLTRGNCERPRDRVGSCRQSLSPPKSSGTSLEIKLKKLIIAIRNQPLVYFYPSRHYATLLRTQRDSDDKQHLKRPANQGGKRRSAPASKMIGSDSGNEGRRDFSRAFALLAVVSLMQHVSVFSPRG